MSVSARGAAKMVSVVLCLACFLDYFLSDSINQITETIAQTSKNVTWALVAVLKVETYSLHCGIIFLFVFTL